jgi:hypothetical protein
LSVGVPTVDADVDNFAAGVAVSSEKNLCNSFFGNWMRLFVVPNPAVAQKIKIL